MKKINRFQLCLRSVAERDSRMAITDLIDPDGLPPRFEGSAAERRKKRETIRFIAQKIRRSKQTVLMYGAHLIKNGLGPAVIRLLEGGWIEHIGTNGAGVIHDWELAWFGRTSEDVRRYVSEGQFGIWQETGFYLNLAAILAWAENRGFGETVGRMIATDRVIIPNPRILEREIQTLEQRFSREKDLFRRGEIRQTLTGKINLLRHIESDFPVFGLCPGTHRIPHPSGAAFQKEISVLGRAYKLEIPFTVHKGIGHDIIDTHPLNDGPAIGAAATNDFLSMGYAQSLLERGVYICVGSSVIAPMIFEKLQSMINNLRIQRKGLPPLRNFLIVVNDIQHEGGWTREPEKRDADYYHRFTKTFRRMGGEFVYFEDDNRKFILNLLAELR
ncbi:MAG: hypothetical protein V1899_05560 [Planctomycetota bacterium]